VNKYVGFLSPHLFFAANNNNNNNNNICPNDRGFFLYSAGCLWVSVRMLCFLQALFEYRPGRLVFCRLSLNIGQDDLFSAGSVWLSARMPCILQALFEYRPGHGILWGLSCFYSVLAENNGLVLQIRPKYPVKFIIYCHQIIQRNEGWINDSVIK
jgi:hypothetical protein